MGQDDENEPGIDVEVGFFGATDGETRVRTDVVISGVVSVRISDGSVPASLISLS